MNEASDEQLNQTRLKKNFLFTGGIPHLRWLHLISNRISGFSKIFRALSVFFYYFDFSSFLVGNKNNFKDWALSRKLFLGSQICKFLIVDFSYALLFVSEIERNSHQSLLANMRILPENFERFRVRQARVKICSLCSRGHWPAIFHNLFDN